MASLLSWNVRGLNTPNKKKEAKRLCSMKEVGLAGLLETKKKGNKINKISTNMIGGWSFVTNLFNHYNGRICITWRPDYFIIVPITMADQMITCEVEYISLQVTFHLFFVDAHNTKEERKELWRSLMDHYATCSKPWLVLGDFNIVLKTTDKIGCNPMTWTEVMEFQNCVEEYELIEIPHRGNYFTWNDKKKNMRVFFKID